MEKRELKPARKKPKESILKKLFFGKFKKYTLFVLLVIVAIGFIVWKVKGINYFNAHRVNTVNTTTLEKMLDIAELSTINYYYNGFTKKIVDGKEKYVVAYEGNVKAGYNFAKIKKNVDNNNKVITLTLPEPEIQVISVDEGSLDYMFRDKKYNNESVFRDALSICKVNLESKIKQEKDFYKMVRENAVSTLNGLIKPYLKAVGNEYELKIEGGYNEKNN